MMKRASVIGVVVALIVGGATCIGFGAMSLRVYGGYSMLDPTDYNDYIQSQADKRETLYGTPGEATVDKLSSSIPYGVDVRFGANPGLMFCLGFTRFSGEAGYSWESTGGTYSIQRADTISAMGGLGSVLYTVGSGDFSLYFGGGAGYYSVNLEKTLPVEDAPGDALEYKAKKNQLGYHGEAGFQYFVTDNIAVGLGFAYRWLTISDMELTEYDISSRVGETWWGPDLDLGGISILVGVNIYT